MTPESASWAGLAAGAPLVLVALCWALLILHSHRPLWRAVDVFLAALLGQGCVRQLLALGLALLQLLGAPSAARGVACSSAVWSLTALHALHAATLASLVLDRALSLRWPRRYKRHPRRNHARYHVCVLTVIAGFVGLAAVFARPPPSVNDSKCAFLPHELEPRFALFAATLHGVLAVSTLVGALVVEIRRRRRPSLLRSTSDLRALAPPNQSDTSTASTASGRGRSSSDSSMLGGKPALISGYDASGAARYCSDTESSMLGAAKQGYGSSLMLTGPYTTWQEPLNKKIALPERLRWSTVVSVLALCYFLHHLPVLAVIIIGSLDPSMLPDWPLDSLALWVGLAQDCLLPVCLVLCDANFGPWVARVYRRQGRHSNSDDKTSPPMFPGLMSELKPNPGRLFAPDPLDGKFPITNGSLFTGGSAVMNNYQIGRGVVRYSRAACMGLAAREIRGYLSHSAADNVGGNNPNPMANSTTWVIKPAPNPQNNNEHQRLSRSESTPPPPPQFATQPSNHRKNDTDSEEECDEEPIYATLSDEMGNLSSLGEDLASRCCSVTTAANDDFVFHRGPQRSNYSDTSSPQTSEDEIQRPEITIEPRRPRIRPRFYHSNSKILDSSSDEDDDIMNQIKNFTDEDDEIKEREIKIKRQASKAHSNISNNNNDNKVQRRVSRNHSRSSNSTKMPSSFSMNDLDRLDIGYHQPPPKNHQYHNNNNNNKNNYLQDENGDLEVVFELPVKSESILSLYRLPFGNEMVRGPADPSRHEPISVRKPSFNRQEQFARRPQGRHMQSSNSRKEQTRHSLGAVLSMDSLHSALARDFSYLDSGELCRHGTSFPDLQRVFVSDYL